jgi:putative ribosome biogenesis GTPase RsgA
MRDLKLQLLKFSCSVDEIAEDQACLDETDEVQKHRVCILGTNDVGKTSLVNQFLTSEYMNTYDASLGMLCTFFLDFFYVNMSEPF